MSITFEQAPDDGKMYCVKCRYKQEANNRTEFKFKSGKLGIKGDCNVCGTMMYRIKLNN